MRQVTEEAGKGALKREKSLIQISERGEMTFSVLSYEAAHLSVQAEKFWGGRKKK